MKRVFGVLLLLAGVLARSESLIGEGERRLQSALLLSTLLDDMVFPGCGANVTKFDATITKGQTTSTISIDLDIELVQSFQQFGDTCVSDGLDLSQLGIEQNPNVTLRGSAISVSTLEVTFESLAIGFMVPNNLVIPDITQCIATITTNFPPELGFGFGFGFASGFCSNLLLPQLGFLQNLTSDNEFINTFPGRFPPSNIDAQINFATQTALGILGGLAPNRTFDPVDETTLDETLERLRNSFLVAPAITGIQNNIEGIQNAIEVIQVLGPAVGFQNQQVISAIFTNIPNLFNIITGEDFFEVVITGEQINQIIQLAFGVIGVNNQTVVINTAVEIIEVLFGDIPDNEQALLVGLTSFLLPAFQSGDFLAFALANVAQVQAFIPDPQIASIVPAILQAFINFQNDRDLDALLRNPFINLLLPIDGDLVTLLVFIQDVNQAPPELLQQIIFVNSGAVSEALNISVSSYFEYIEYAFDVLSSNNTFDALISGFQGLSAQAQSELPNVLFQVIGFFEPFVDLFVGFFEEDYYYGGYNNTGNSTDFYYEYDFDFIFSNYFDFLFGGGGNSTFDIFSLLTTGGLAQVLQSPFLDELFSIADPATSIFDFPDVLLATQMLVIQEAFSDNFIVSNILDIIQGRSPAPAYFGFATFEQVLQGFIAENVPSSGSDIEFDLNEFLDSVLFEIVDFLFTVPAFQDPYFNFPDGFNGKNLLSATLGVEDGKIVFPEFLGLASDLVIDQVTFAANVSISDFSRNGAAFLLPALDFTFGDAFVAVEYQGQRLELETSLSVIAEQALLLFVDYTTLGDFGFGNFTTLPSLQPIVEDFVDCAVSTVAASIGAQNVAAQFQILSEFLVGNLTDLLFLTPELASLPQAAFIDFPAEQGDDLTEGAIEDIVAELLFLYSPALPTAIELAPKALPQQVPILFADLTGEGFAACQRNPFFVPEDIDDGGDDSGEDTDDGGDGDGDDDDAGDEDEVPVEILAGAGAAGVVAAAVAGYVAFSGGAAAAAAGGTVAAGAGGAVAAGAGGAGAAKAGADAAAGATAAEQAAKKEAMEKAL